MTLREAATSIAARVPTQVKLLFATLAYYAVICVVFWQVENWPVLDSIYFATGIMSTVGTGDLFPSEDDGLALVHALTIIFAFSGIVLILPVYAFIVSLVFTPLNSWLRRQISKVRPPHKTIAVEGVDGQSTTIPVPTRAFVYYAGELAPAFCLWLAQQFLFSALLCWAQPGMLYADSIYHTLLTASTVGAFDTPIETDAAKVVVTLHILISVGTLSAILQDAASLHTERKKMEERLQLMMRKSDPLLLEELHQSYVEAANEFDYKPDRPKFRRQGSVASKRWSQFTRRWSMARRSSGRSSNGNIAVSMANMAAAMAGRRSNGDDDADGRRNSGSGPAGDVAESYFSDFSTRLRPGGHLTWGGVLTWAS